MKNRRKMTNYKSGHDAENHSARYLKSKGFKVLDQNWKTPRCEIDIVAGKGDTVYFVEVKYRKTGQQGSGLEYITPKKITQMQFAAECWISANKYTGEYELSAIEVSGSAYKITAFLPNIL